MKRTDLLHLHTDDPCEECAKHERESTTLKNIATLAGHAFDFGFIAAAGYWAWKGQWFTAWAILVLLSLHQIARGVRK
jgi:hypothetical protein